MLLLRTRALPNPSSQEDNADTDNDSISLTNDETEEEDDDPPPSVQEVTLVTSSSLDRQDTVDSLVIEETSGREDPVAPPEDEVGLDALSADLADDLEEVD